MGTFVKNWYTTVLGFAAGFINYMVVQGATVPDTKAKWGTLLFSAALAGLGLVAKDASTGSKPQA